MRYTTHRREELFASRIGQSTVRFSAWILERLGKLLTWKASTCFTDLEKATCISINLGGHLRDENVSSSLASGRREGTALAGGANQE